MLREKIARVTAEEVRLVPYDPEWPRRFEEERARLRGCLPRELIRRIEHFGSTAVPGLVAKPVVDLLVEVTDLGETRRRIAPILEARGYDYFWRPTRGDEGPPFYAWFIRRDGRGIRTHHVHMVEARFEHWDRLLFRDYLIEFPRVARAYGELKVGLARAVGGDRIAYTEGKARFVEETTERAQAYYGGGTGTEGTPSPSPERREDPGARSLPRRRSDRP